VWRAAREEGEGVGARALGEKKRKRGKEKKGKPESERETQLPLHFFFLFLSVPPTGLTKMIATLTRGGAFRKGIEIFCALPDLDVQADTAIANAVISACDKGRGRGTGKQTNVH
jgi:hypothetical protein